MNKVELFKEEIIGTSVAKIQRSKDPISEFYLEGLGNLFSYIFVIELNNGSKYEFLYDYLCVWDERVELVTLESNYDNDFIGKKIEDVITCKETSGIFFKLENEMILYHNNDFGSELECAHYSEIFNSDGRLL